MNNDEKMLSQLKTQVDYIINNNIINAYSMMECLEKLLELIYMPETEVYYEKLCNHLSKVNKISGLYYQNKVIRVKQLLKEMSFEQEGEFIK